MRRPVSIVIVAFTAFAGVWFAAPAAGTGSGSCSGDVVVSIGTKLRAHPSLNTVVVDLTAPIGPGDYMVTSFSSDTRSGTDKVQENEQWTVTLVAAAGPVTTLGPTSDLDDHVLYTSVADTLGPVTITDPVVSLTIRHVSSSGGGDSVTAECVGFTLLGESPTDDDDEPSGPGPDDDDDDGEPSGPGPDDDDDDDDDEPSGPGPDDDDDDDEPSGPGPDDDDDDGEPSGPGPDDDDEPSGPGPATDPSPTAPRPPPARISSAARVDCGEGTINITVVNDGGRDAIVDVAVPRSGVARALGVGPGQTTTTTVPISPDTEDRRLAIRVIDSATGGDLTSTVVGVDCLAEPDVSASVVLDCPAELVLVELVNRGGEPTGITVLSARGSLERVDLAAGSTTHVELVTAGRDEIQVLVLAEDGVRVLDQLVEIDCPRPRLSASANVDCATGEVVAEIRNSGELTGSATVWFSDRVLEVRVEAGSAVSVGSPFAAMRSDPVVSVDSGGETIYTTTVEAACVEPGAALDVDCRSLALDLSNSGDGTAEFVVEMLVGGVTTLRQEVSVPTGLASFAIPPVDGFDWVIRVTEKSHEDVIAEFTGELDCRRPWADVQIDCPAGAAELRLGVEGSHGARFVVLADDVVVDRWLAIGGASTERMFALGPEVETVTVLADSSSGPLATSPVVCERGHGQSRPASALVTVMVAISLVTAVAWKGI